MKISLNICNNWFVSGLPDCPIDWTLYESVSKEKALIKCLLDRYKTYSTVGRPVNETSNMISVEFGLSLIQIMDVDEKNQVLETNVWYTYVSITDVLEHVYSSRTAICSC